MATGPHSLFDYDSAKLKAAEDFIDGLLNNPPASLSAGPGGEKPVFVKSESSIQIRLIGIQPLTRSERHLLREIYRRAGWHMTSARTSKDRTHTVVTLWA